MIGWILCRNFAHCIAVCDEACGLWRRFKIAVKRGDDGNVVTFALRFSTCVLAELRACAPRLQLTLFLRPGGERIAPLAQSDAPVGDSAGRIVFQGGVETLDCISEFEGVKKRDGAIKLFLRVGIAGRGEMNSAEFFAGTVRMLLCGTTASSEHQCDNTNYSSGPHIGLHLRK